MYSELYEIWKNELDSDEVSRLPTDFYSKIVSYMNKLKEESRMLDRRTVKARLLRNEKRNAERMVLELIRTRYRKSVAKIVEGEKIPSGVLTAEEEKIYTGVSSLAETYESFAKGIMHGYIPRVDVEQKQKRTVLRFLKDVPAIIGADMEAYGPFKVEDVASLPTENAKILVKQSLSEKIEVSLL